MDSIMPLASIFGEGIIPLGIVLFIGLLIFGKRLPEVGRGLGRSIMEFKKGMSDVSNSVTSDVSPTPAIPPANTQPALPSNGDAKMNQSTEERIAKLTAELQSLQQEMAKQKTTPSA